MDVARTALSDLDQLEPAELKALLLEQHEQLLDRNERLIDKDEQLRAKDEQLLATNAQLRERDDQLRFNRLEIEHLKLQIAKLRRLQFGAKSEKYTQEIEQLELRVEELETTDAQLEAALPEKSASRRETAPQKPRRSFPDQLPRETETIASQHDACPDCGGELKHLSDDISEMLELEPVRFKVIRRVRPKFACGSCDTIVQAPAPARPIDRGMAGPALLAHILTGKYGDHLPLYRQSQIFAREGIDLPRSLLAQWVGAVRALLTPLADALQKHIFAADVVHADDTPLPVLAPGTGKTKTGRLWTYVRDERPCGGTSAPAVWFTFTADRRGEHPQQHLKDFTGILQADGYAGYSKLYESGSIAEAACWAHVRRKFFDLHQANHSTIAAQALERIGALYAIEEQVRGRPPDERCAVRRERSRPLLDAMHDWLQEALQTLSQKSATAKAILYALNRWEALVRYCDDGRIEIDNNAAERALRCVALGRKNFLFVGSDAGGDRAAAIYSLIGTAKLNGHNPEAYLREVLTRIADHPTTRIPALLPWNLQAEQPIAVDATTES